MKTNEIPLSVGAIAKELGEPIRRVRHAIGQAGIPALARAGNALVYRRDQLEAIRDAVAKVRRKSVRA